VSSRGTTVVEGHAASSASRVFVASTQSRNVSTRSVVVGGRPSTRTASNSGAASLTGFAVNAPSFGRPSGPVLTALPLAR
jgi:hypothetical protein